MSGKLELVREEKLFRLLPGRRESSRLEASGVALVDDKTALVVFDNLNQVARHQRAMAILLVTAAFLRLGVSFLPYLKGDGGFRYRARALFVKFPGDPRIVRTEECPGEELPNTPYRTGPRPPPQRGLARSGARA